MRLDAEVYSNTMFSLCNRFIRETLSGNAEGYKVFCIQLETQIKNASKEAITRYKNNIDDALTSIKAIVAMASFIDDHDDTAKAKQCLFIYTNDLYCPDEYYSEDMKSLINSLIKRQSGKN